MTPAFDWSEYLRLANDLAKNSDEASHRTSISRAYYSIYHAAASRAEANGCAPKTHKELWNLYRRDPDRNCLKLSTLGYTMRVAREDADYQEVVVDVAGILNQQIEDANRFLAALSSLPSESPHKI